MNKQKPTDKKIDPAVRLAIIGGVVTIATAIIAALSPIALEYIRRAPAPSETSSLRALATSVSTLTPSSTPLVNTVAPDWKQLMSATVDDGGICQGLLLPPNIKPDQSSSEAIKQINAEENATQGKFTAWLLATNPNSNGGTLALTITNLSKQATWVKLSNKLELSIKSQSNPPDQVHVVMGSGCGGAALYRHFSDVALASDYQNYTTTSVSSDSDFFTLQPGEFEVFEVPFTCKSLGTYRITFSVPYSILGIDGRIDYEDGRSIVCPSTFTVWDWGSISHTFVSSTSYVWNGKSYEKRSK